MNIQTALAHARSQESLDPTASKDMASLLCYLLNCNQSFLYSHPETRLLEATQEKLQTLWARRLQGEPLAYLLEQWEFWSLPLQVTPATLIPRPETEILVAEVLALYAKTDCGTLLELGTGSGAISIALSIERPNLQIFALERSAEALAVAINNGKRHHCANINWQLGDWQKPPAWPPLDLLISNPPYLANDDPHLKDRALQFEPSEALIAGQTGLECYHTIAMIGRNTLKPNSHLLLEHGYQQKDALIDLLQTYGYSHMRSVIDGQGHPRVLIART